MAEKNINEISREARLLYTKANEAAQRENVDYAIALYNQVLEKAGVLRRPQGVALRRSSKRPGAAASGFSKRC